MKTQWKMKSIIGPLYLVASENGLHGVHWGEQEVPFAKSLDSQSSTDQDHLKALKYLTQAMQEIAEYLEGTRKKFDIKTEATGTEFQKRVWNELSKIPYGKTVSYQDIANKLKSKAVRAVGSANGKNPLSLIVPCHRVITSGGRLGGYAGGLTTKTRLLELESPGRIIEK